MKVKIAVVVVAVLFICVFIANWVVGGIMEKNFEEEARSELETFPFPVTFSDISVNPMFLEASVRDVTFVIEEYNINIRCEEIEVDLSLSDAMKILRGEEIQGIHSFSIEMDELDIAYGEENFRVTLGDFSFKFDGHITEEMLALETEGFPGERQQIELKFDELTLRIPPEIINQYLQTDMGNEILLLKESSMKIVYDPDEHKISIDSDASTDPVYSGAGALVFEYEGDSIGSFVPKRITGESFFDLNFGERTIGDPDKFGRYSLRKIEVESSFDNEFEELPDLLAAISEGKMLNSEATFLLEGLKVEFSDAFMEGSGFGMYEEMLGIDLNEISVEKYSFSYKMNGSELKISDAELLTSYIKVFLDADLTLDAVMLENSIINSAKIIIRDISPELEPMLESLELGLGQPLRREGSDVIIELSGYLNNPVIKD